MKYPGFYFSENIIDFPNQVAIIKLSFPRLFIRFQYDEEGHFANYEIWKNNLITIEWLDPSDKPESKKEIENILTECWNFLASHEAEEDKLFEENNGYKDNL